MQVKGASKQSFLLLFRDFKNYKIHLHVDHLGFEDMLMTLRTKYHFRVYIEDMPVLHMVLEKLNLLEYFDTTKEEAQIIVMSNTKTDTVENLERYVCCVCSVF